LLAGAAACAASLARLRARSTYWPTLERRHQFRVAHPGRQGRPETLISYKP
jgi:hypothetical protein